MVKQDLGSTKSQGIIVGAMSNKEEVQVIIAKDGKYHLYNYESEIELERMIIEHFSEIFGENTYYFDIKKKINSRAGFGTVPDGYVIDFKKKKLYIIEVEMIKHDLRRHIRNQIIDFLQALDNEKTCEKLIEIFQKELPPAKKIKEKELKAIVNNRGIIILIDDIGDPMKEINPLLETVNFLSKFAEVKAIPFQTYIKSGGYSRDHVHSFKSFTREELEKESKKWTFKWTTVPKERHFDKTDEKMKSVLSALSEQICFLPNVKEKSRKGWITYQTSPLKNFCTIKVLPNSLEVHLKCDKSFADEKGMAKNINRTAAWTFDKVFTIASQDDLEYAMHLIKQAYGCICKKG